MDSSIPYLGEILSLLAAIIWPLAVILFKKSGETVHPIALNLFKNIIAFILFLITFVIFKQTILLDVPAADYILLMASGALGIGLGDSMFFESLNRLGAGLSAIVICLYSPFVIILSVLFLNDSLSIIQIIGVILVVSAVLVASFERGVGKVSRRDIMWGIFWGVMANIVMAVGIVMIKPLLNRSPLLWVTEVRLLGGIISLFIILLLFPQRRPILSTLTIKRGWLYTLSGSFIGAYLGMIVWLAGNKYTQTSTASALNQTTNLFLFIFAFLLLRERITLRRGIGIIMGVIGALLVSFGNHISVSKIFSFFV